MRPDFIQIGDTFINQGQGNIVRVYLSQRKEYQDGSIVLTLCLVTTDVEKNRTEDGQVYTSNHEEEYDLESPEGKGLLAYLNLYSTVLFPSKIFSGDKFLRTLEKENARAESAKRREQEKTLQEQIRQEQIHYKKHLETLRQQEEHLDRFGL